MSFRTGIWTTEAPLGTDVLREHRKRLDALMTETEPIEGVQIRWAEAWVDGVLWTYRRLDTIR